VADRALVVPLSLAEHGAPGRQIFYRVVAQTLSYQTAHKLQRGERVVTAVFREARDLLFSFPLARHCVAHHSLDFFRDADRWAGFLRRLADASRMACWRLAMACGLSAWPVISYRKRLGIVSRGLPHFMRVSGKDSVSRSRARVTPT